MHTGTMAPKGKSSKKNTKKKLAPKYDYHLINEETSEWSGNLAEYLIKKIAQTRETLPRGNKTPTKVVTSPKKTIRMKQPITSSPHSTLFSKDDENIESKGDAREEELSLFEVDSENTSGGGGGRGEVYDLNRCSTTSPPLLNLVSH